MKPSNRSECQLAKWVVLALILAFSSFAALADVPRVTKAGSPRSRGENVGKQVSAPSVQGQVRLDIARLDDVTVDDDLEQCVGSICKAYVPGDTEGFEVSLPVIGVDSEQFAEGKTFCLKIVGPDDRIRGSVSAVCDGDEIQFEGGEIPIDPADFTKSWKLRGTAAGVVDVALIAYEDGVARCSDTVRLSIAPVLPNPGKILLVAPGAGEQNLLYVAGADPTFQPSGTIADALSRAADDDNVVIARGTYHESDLGVQSRVLVVGLGGSIDTNVPFSQNLTGLPIVLGDSQNAVFVVTADSPQIVGLSIRDAGTGVYFLSCNDPVVRLCQISLSDEAGTVGIVMDQCEGFYLPAVEACQVSGSGRGRGVYARNQVQCFLDVSRCVIQGCEVGVDCDGGSISVGCCVIGNDGVGVRLNNVGDWTWFTSIQIGDCAIQDCDMGIEWENASDGSVQGCLICGNGTGVMVSTDFQLDYGLVSVEDSLMENNGIGISANQPTAVTYSSIEGNGVGVRFEGVPNQNLGFIDDSIAQGNAVGIEIISGRAGITRSAVVNNNVGVYCQTFGDNFGDANAAIQYCSFEANGSAAVEAVGSPDWIVGTASCWWGSAGGPYDPSDDRLQGGLFNPNPEGQYVTDHVNYLCPEVARLHDVEIVTPDSFPVYVRKGESIAVAAQTIPVGLTGDYYWDGEGVFLDYDSQATTFTPTAVGAYALAAEFFEPGQTMRRSAPGTVIVWRPESVEVKPVIADESAFGPTAAIGVGGGASDVHKANVRITVFPAIANIPVKVTLDGAEGYQGEAVPAELTVGSVTLSGNGDQEFTTNDQGIVEGILISSNVAKTCTITVGDVSADVDFQWGTVIWDYDPEFLYGEWTPTSLKLMQGDLPLDGHTMRFYVTRVRGVKLVEGEYVGFDLNIDDDGDLSYYSEFADDSSGNGSGVVSENQGSPGRYTAYQKVYDRSGSDIFTDWVEFWTVDDHTYSRSAPQ